MSDRFKPIPSRRFRGYYEIEGYSGYCASPNGEILNKTTRTSSKGSVSGRYYRKSVYRDGYDEPVLAYTHILVCIAFKGPANGRFVLHQDGDNLNVDESNLEWGTQSENMEQWHEHRRQREADEIATEANKIKPTWDPSFGPSYTPMEMLDLGIFEGIYTHAIKGIPKKYTSHPKVLGKQGPDVKINKFGVYARQSLSAWRDNGWTTKDSPLGWWEWYIKYFEGRRLPEEDKWQIGRWRSFIARHQAQIVASGKMGDMTQRVRQRQSLLQWGWNSKSIVTDRSIIYNARRVSALAGVELGTRAKPNWM